MTRVFERRREKGGLVPHAFKKAMVIITGSYAFPHPRLFDRHVCGVAASTGAASRPAYKHRGIGYDYAFADAVGENVVSLTSYQCPDVAHSSRSEKFLSLDV